MASTLVFILFLAVFLLILTCFVLLRLDEEPYALGTGGTLEIFLQNCRVRFIVKDDISQPEYLVRQYKSLDWWDHTLTSSVAGGALDFRLESTYTNLAHCGLELHLPVGTTFSAVSVTCKDTCIITTDTGEEEALSPWSPKWYVTDAFEVLPDMSGGSASVKLAELSVGRLNVSAGDDVHLENVLIQGVGSSVVNTTNGDLYAQLRSDVRIEWANSTNYFCISAPVVPNFTIDSACNSENSVSQAQGGATETGDMTAHCGGEITLHSEAEGANQTIDLFVHVPAGTFYATRPPQDVYEYDVADLRTVTGSGFIVDANTGIGMQLDENTSAAFGRMKTQLAALGDSEVMYVLTSKGSPRLLRPRNGMIFVVTRTAASTQIGPWMLQTVSLGMLVRRVEVVPIRWRAGACPYQPIMSLDMLKRVANALEAEGIDSPSNNVISYVMPAGKTAGVDPQFGPEVLQTATISLENSLGFRGEWYRMGKDYGFDELTFFENGALFAAFIIYLFDATVVSFIILFFLYLQLSAATWRLGYSSSHIKRYRQQQQQQQQQQITDVARATGAAAATTDFAVVQDPSGPRAISFVGVPDADGEPSEPEARGEPCWGFCSACPCCKRRERSRAEKEDVGLQSAIYDFFGLNRRTLWLHELPPLFDYVACLVGMLRTKYADSRSDFLCIPGAVRPLRPGETPPAPALGDVKAVYSRYCFLAGQKEHQLKNDQGVKVLETYGLRIQELIPSEQAVAFLGICFLQRGKGAALDVRAHGETSLDYFIRTQCERTNFDSDTIELREFRVRYADFCEKHRLINTIPVSRAVMAEKGINTVTISSSQIVPLPEKDAGHRNVLDLEAAARHVDALVSGDIDVKSQRTLQAYWWVFDILFFLVVVAICFLLPFLPWTPIIVLMNSGLAPVAGSSQYYQFSDIGEFPTLFLTKFWHWYPYFTVVWIVTIPPAYILHFSELVVYYWKLEYPIDALSTFAHYIEKAEGGVIPRARSWFRKIVHVFQWVILLWAAYWNIFMGVGIVIWLTLGAMINPEAFLAYATAVVTLITFVTAKYVKLKELFTKSADQIAVAMENQLQAVASEMVKAVLGKFENPGSFGSIVGLEGGTVAGFSVPDIPGVPGGVVETLASAVNAVSDSSIARNIISQGLDVSTMVGLATGDTSVLTAFAEHHGIPVELVTIMTCAASNDTDGVVQAVSKLLARYQDASPVHPELAMALVHLLREPTKAQVEKVLQASLDHVVPAVIKKQFGHNIDQDAYHMIIETLPPLLKGCMSMITKQDTSQFIEALRVAQRAMILQKHEAERLVGDAVGCDLIANVGPVFEVLDLITGTTSIQNCIIALAQDKNILDIPDAVAEWLRLVMFARGPEGVADLASNASREANVLCRKWLLSCRERRKLLTKTFEAMHLDQSLVIILECLLAWAVGDSAFFVDLSVGKRFASLVVSMAKKNPASQVLVPHEKVVARAFSMAMGFLVLRRAGTETAMFEGARKRAGISIDIAKELFESIIISNVYTGTQPQDMDKWAVLGSMADSLGMRISDVVGMVHLLMGHAGTQDAVRLIQDVLDRQGKGTPGLASFISSCLDLSFGKNDQAVMRAMQQLNIEHRWYGLIGLGRAHPRYFSEELLRRVGMTSDDVLRKRLLLPFSYEENPGAWNEWLRNSTSSLGADEVLVWRDPVFFQRVVGALEDDGDDGEAFDVGDGAATILAAMRLKMNSGAKGVKGIRDKLSRMRLEAREERQVQAGEADRGTPAEAEVAAAHVGLQGVAKATATLATFSASFVASPDVPAVHDAAPGAPIVRSLDGEEQCILPGAVGAESETSALLLPSPASLSMVHAGTPADHTGSFVAVRSSESGLSQPRRSYKTGGTSRESRMKRKVSSGVKGLAALSPQFQMDRLLLGLRTQQFSEEMVELLIHNFNSAAGDENHGVGASTVVVHKEIVVARQHADRMRETEGGGRHRLQVSDGHIRLVVRILEIASLLQPHFLGNQQMDSSLRKAVIEKFAKMLDIPAHEFEILFDVFLPESLEDIVTAVEHVMRQKMPEAAAHGVAQFAASLQDSLRIFPSLRNFLWRLADRFKLPRFLGPAILLTRMSYPPQIRETFSMLTYVVEPLLSGSYAHAIQSTIGDVTGILFRSANFRRPRDFLKLFGVVPMTSGPTDCETLVEMFGIVFAPDARSKLDALPTFIQHLVDARKEDRSQPDECPSEPISMLAMLKEQERAEAVQVAQETMLFLPYLFYFAGFPFALVDAWQDDSGQAPAVEILQKRTGLRQEVLAGMEFCFKSLSSTSRSRTHTLDSKSANALLQPMFGRVRQQRPNCSSQIPSSDLLTAIISLGFCEIEGLEALAEALGTDTFLLQVLVLLVKVARSADDGGSLATSIQDIGANYGMCKGLKQLGISPEKFTTLCELSFPRKEDLRVVPVLMERLGLSDDSGDLVSFMYLCACCVRQLYLGNVDGSGDESMANIVKAQADLIADTIDCSSSSVMVLMTRLFQGDFQVLRNKGMEREIQLLLPLTFDKLLARGVCGLLSHEPLAFSYAPIVVSGVAVLEFESSNVATSTVSSDIKLPREPTRITLVLPDDAGVTIEDFRISVQWDEVSPYTFKITLEGPLDWRERLSVRWFAYPNVNAQDLRALQVQNARKALNMYMKFYKTRMSHHGAHWGAAARIWEESELGFAVHPLFLLLANCDVSAIRCAADLLGVSEVIIAFLFGIAAAPYLHKNVVHPDMPPLVGCANQLRPLLLSDLCIKGVCEGIMHRHPEFAGRDTSPPSNTFKTGADAEAGFDLPSNVWAMQLQHPPDGTSAVPKKVSFSGEHGEEKNEEAEEDGADALSTDSEMTAEENNTNENNMDSSGEALQTEQSGGMDTNSLFGLLHGLDENLYPDEFVELFGDDLVFDQDGVDDPFQSFKELMGDTLWERWVVDGYVVDSGAFVESALDALEGLDVNVGAESADKRKYCYDPEGVLSSIFRCWHEPVPNNLHIMLTLMLMKLHLLLWMDDGKPSTPRSYHQQSLLFPDDVVLALRKAPSVSLIAGLAQLRQAQLVSAECKPAERHAKAGSRLVVAMWCIENHTRLVIDDKVRRNMEQEATLALDVEDVPLPFVDDPLYGFTLPAVLAFSQGAPENWYWFNWEWPQSVGDEHGDLLVNICARVCQVARFATGIAQPLTILHPGDQDMPQGQSASAVKECSQQRGWRIMMGSGCEQNECTEVQSDRRLLFQDLMCESTASVILVLASGGADWRGINFSFSSLVRKHMPESLTNFCDRSAVYDGIMGLFSTSLDSPAFRPGHHSRMVPSLGYVLRKLAEVKLPPDGAAGLRIKRWAQPLCPLFGANPQIVEALLQIAHGYLQGGTGQPVSKRSLEALGRRMRLGEERADLLCALFGRDFGVQNSAVLAAALHLPADIVGHIIAATRRDVQGWIGLHRALSELIAPSEGCEYRRLRSMAKVGGLRHTVSSAEAGGSEAEALVSIAADRFLDCLIQLDYFQKGALENEQYMLADQSERLRMVLASTILPALCPDYAYGGSPLAAKFACGIQIAFHLLSGQNEAAIESALWNDELRERLSLQLETTRERARSVVMLAGSGARRRPTRQDMDRRVNALVSPIFEHMKAAILKCEPSGAAASVDAQYMSQIRAPLSGEEAVEFLSKRKLSLVCIMFGVALADNRLLLRGVRKIILLNIKAQAGSDVKATCNTIAAELMSEPSGQMLDWIQNSPAVRSLVLCTSLQSMRKLQKVSGKVSVGLHHVVESVQAAATNARDAAEVQIEEVLKAGRESSGEAAMQNLRLNRVGIHVLDNAGRAAARLRQHTRMQQHFFIAVLTSYMQDANMPKEELTAFLTRAEQVFVPALSALACGCFDQAFDCFSAVVSQEFLGQFHVVMDVVVLLGITRAQFIQRLKATPTGESVGIVRTFVRHLVNIIRNKRLVKGKPLVGSRKMQEIPDRAITASSYCPGDASSQDVGESTPCAGDGGCDATISGPTTWQVRLDDQKKIWVAGSDTNQEWVQFDFGSMKDVVRVQTLGHRGTDMWPKKIRLEYCREFPPEVWHKVIGPVEVGEGVTGFNANFDATSAAENVLNPSVTCRCMRIYIVEWNGCKPSLRADFVGCAFVDDMVERLVASSADHLFDLFVAHSVGSPREVIAKCIENLIPDMAQLAKLLLKQHPHMQVAASNLIDIMQVIAKRRNKGAWEETFFEPLKTGERKGQIPIEKIVESIQALLLPFLHEDVHPQIVAVLRIAMELRHVATVPQSLRKSMPVIIEQFAIALGKSKQSLEGIVALAHGDWAGAVEFCKPFCDLNPEVMEQVAKLLPTVKNAFAVAAEEAETFVNKDQYEHLKMVAQDAMRGGASAKDLFQVVDINKNGEISSEEFKQLMRRLGFELSDHRVSEIFSHCKVDIGSGGFTEAEFKQALSYAESVVTVKTMDVLGKSWGQMLGGLILMTFILFLMIIFLFLGIAAFLSGGVFSSVVNSLMTIAAGLGLSKKTHGEQDNTQPDAVAQTLTKVQDSIFNEK